MTSQFEISAELRGEIGKGASRRLRHAGSVPAIMYGGGKDPQAIKVNANELLVHLEFEAFYSHILNLKFEHGVERVVLKDLHRHPYKRAILHADFLRVSEQEKITMRVPLHFLNEDKCVGIKQEGGIPSHLMAELEILCLPKDLPEYIAVDVSQVHINTTIHLSELQLPNGVESSILHHGGDGQTPVYSVHAVKGGGTSDEAAA